MGFTDTVNIKTLVALGKERCIPVYADVGSGVLINFKNKVFVNNIKQNNYDDLLQFLIDSNLIKIDNNYISLKEFHVIYTEEQNIINDSIVARCWCIC